MAVLDGRDGSKHATIILYIIAFMDMFGVSLIIPLIMSHAKSLGATPATAGLIGSIYGAIQLISGPIVGKWSDKSGRRHVLVICLVICAPGYALAGVWRSLWVLVVARIPLGIFKHTQEITKAYLADITPEEWHSAVYGYINAAGSAGFILGPLVGGHLAETSFNEAYILSGSIMALTAVIVYTFLPEAISKPHPDLTRDESATSLKKLGSDEISFSLKELITSFKKIHWEYLWDIFLYRFLLGASMLIFRSNFSLMLEYKFEVTPKIIGYVISYNGIVGALSGFFIGKIASFYSDENKLLQHNTIATLVSMIALTFAPTVEILVILMTPLSLCNVISRVCITKLTIRKGGTQEAGALFGLGQSVMSIARMLAPLIGGIAQEVSVNGPGYVGSAIAISALALVLLHPMDRVPAKEVGKQK